MQRAELEPCDILEKDRGLARGAGAEHNLAELLGRAQPAERVDLHLEGGAGGRGRGAELAGRDLHVLFRDRLLHVDGGDPELGELVGIEPHAHGVAPFTEQRHVADARHAL